MHYQSFNDRMLKKLQNLTWQYAGYIYHAEQTFSEVLGYETKEHHRQAPDVEYLPVKDGYVWGGEFGNLWVKFDYTVPAELDGKELFVLQNTELREGLLFVDGKPMGMYGTIIKEYDGLQHNILLTQKAEAGKTYHVDLECYAWHDEREVHPYAREENLPDEHYRHTFHNVYVATCNWEIKNFVRDLRILLSMAQINQNPFLKARAINMLERVFGEAVLHPTMVDYETVIAGVRRCNEIMSEMFTGQTCGDAYGKVGIVGHSHMDTAWLWPIAETIRKCARTFANALVLMDQYADYKFIQSSVLHTYWMEDKYPEIFEDIKKRQAEGRFEVNGGAWVE